MTIESCSYRSHYVQKALQSNFATTDGKAKKIFFAHIEHKDGWTINIDSNMKQKGLYPDDIEALFNSKVKKDFTELCRKLCTSKTISIHRYEFDTIKKYILLQLIRTPAEIERIRKYLLEASIPSYISECVSDRRTNESEKDYWFRILRTVLKNNWEELRSCDCPYVRSLSRVIDRMTPLLVETRDDLILPDSGVSRYAIWCTPQKKDWIKDLNEVFNKTYGFEQSLIIAGDGGPFLVFICLPMDKNHALMLVEDIVRLNPVATNPIHIEFFSELKYNTRIKYRNYHSSDKKIGIEDMQKYWSPDDEITLTRQFAKQETVNELNYLALKDLDIGFSFNNLDGIRTFIQFE